MTLETTNKWVSPSLTWHALVHLYKGYLCKALSSVAEDPAYALRGGPVFNQPKYGVTSLCFVWERHAWPGWLVLYYWTSLRTYAGSSATEDNALQK